MRRNFMEPSALPPLGQTMCLWSSLRPALYKQQRCKDDGGGGLPWEPSRSNERQEFSKKWRLTQRQRVTGTVLHRLAQEGCSEQDL